MSIFSWFKRNEHKSLSAEEWAETELGKRFVEDVEMRRLEKYEWEKNVPQDRKDQVKLFKIFFSIFFGIYFVALFAGFKKGCPLAVFGIETLVSCLGFVLFKVKPKKVKYPNCFMMPVLASFCMFFLYVYLAAGFFGYWFKKPAPAAELEKIEKPDGRLLSEKEFSELEYSKFLKDNNVIDSDSLTESYEEYRRGYGGQ